MARRLDAFAKLLAKRLPTIVDAAEEGLFRPKAETAVLFFAGSLSFELSGEETKGEVTC